MRAEPMQARAVATREKIIAAARELYHDPNIGRDRLETASVAAKAGVSIGTVYRYFEDRVDLMDVVAPERDYPSLELLQKVANWGPELPPGTAREVVDFLEEAL